IYLRLPQWSNIQSMLTLRHMVFFVGAAIVIVILVTLFTASLMRDNDNNTTPASKHFLPTVNYGNKELDLQYFNHGARVHYGIVLDCGSSGTRVYVYVWPPHSGDPQDLLNIQQLKDHSNQPVAKKVTPGLDTFADRPENASDYLEPLLQFAASHIPKEQHKETLLYILATAGMRLLPEVSQQAILQDLQRDIPKKFDFVIAENNFEVISGKLEGVYAWIAANYALQKFNHGDADKYDHPLVAVDIADENGEITQHVRRRTVGMLDMGGGSMQIAYEITANADSIPKHLMAEFNLGCRSYDKEHTYKVYVTTFLGYGANEARTRYEQQLVQQVKERQSVKQKQAALLGMADPGQVKIHQEPVKEPVVDTKREESQQRVIDSQQGVLDSQRPVVDSQQSVIDSHHGFLDSQRPIVDSQLLQHQVRRVVDLQNPVVDSQQRVSNSQQQVLDAQHPIGDSQPPVLDSQQQVFYLQKPVVDSQQQVLDSQHPFVQSQQRVLDSQHPAKDSQQQVLDSYHNAIESDHQVLVKDSQQQVLDSHAVQSINDPIQILPQVPAGKLDIAQPGKDGDLMQTRLKRSIINEVPLLDKQSASLNKRTVNISAAAISSNHIKEQIPNGGTIHQVRPRNISPPQDLNNMGQRTNPFASISDPCLQDGLALPPRDPDDLDLDPGVEVTFVGTGDYRACKTTLEPLLNRTVPCKLSPCSMNGVHQPEILYKNSQFYGFSEFWYTMEDVFRIGGNYEAGIFETYAKDFCGKQWSLLMTQHKKGLYQKADMERLKLECFKSAWMTTVLHMGLGFPTEYKGLQSVQLINNGDVQWTLGALIHRTRYLPLREIQEHSESKFKPSWLISSHILYNEYLLVICFVIVVMAIIIYCRRLRLCAKKTGRPDMKNVPSMSYFMTEMDQVESGVRQLNEYSYPNDR
ncbi:hypothetical protein DPMN_067409, partial [Dreissena polymorpha]